MNFKFSLRTLIVSILAVCFLLTWYNQWRQAQTINALKSELNEAKTDHEFHRAISILTLGTQRDKELHQRVLRILGQADLRKAHPYSQQYAPANPHTFPLSENDEGREIIILSRRRKSIYWGSTETIAALVDDDYVIDTMIFQSEVGREQHEPSVEDTDEDGVLELVFNIHPWAFSRTKKARQVSFPIGPRGFIDPADRVHAARRN